MLAIKAAMGARDVRVSRMVASPSARTESRTVTCLSVTSAATTPMHEVQRVGRAAGGARVLWSATSMADGMYAHYFAATMKFALLPDASSSAATAAPAAAAARTRVEVSCEVVFHKATLVRRQIERAVLDEAKAACELTMPLVRRMLRERAGADAAAGADDDVPTGVPLAPPPAPLVLARSAPPAAPLKASWWATALSGWLVALLLLLALLWQLPGARAARTPLPPLLDESSPCAEVVGDSARDAAAGGARLGACTEAIDASIREMRAQLKSATALQRQLRQATVAVG